MQLDYYQMASALYSLLVSKRMEVVQDEDGSVTVKEKLVSYLQTTLWNQLFDTLLNADQTSAQPATLAGLRAAFEQYFIRNPLKCQALNGLIHSLEARLSA